MVPHKGYHGMATSSAPIRSRMNACCAPARCSPPTTPQGRYSSSVPVNCAIRQLKKVPGSKAGMVTMQSYRTIYIDPDAKAIEHCMPS
ncbi:MAG: hypothetical protein V8T10_03630 [Merdibacter sp.]